MTQDELLVATAIASWKQVVGRIDKSVAALSEEQMQKQVAPGKNRIAYLIGHLTAVHDRMIPLLGLGERLHPELDEAYVTNPDKALPDPVTPAELKAVWSEVNAAFLAAAEKLTAAEWLQAHTAVSAEDFAKEPLRNRLSVFLSRTNHLSFHAGQMVLTK